MDNAILIQTEINGVKYRRRISQTAIITLNGKPANIEELKQGDAVTLINDPADEVIATRGTLPVVPEPPPIEVEADMETTTSLSVESLPYEP